MRGLAIVVIAVGNVVPPTQGTVVPGASFGGLRLGATPAAVRAAWGTAYGICRNCRDRTWYYNSRTFEPRGVAVAFRAGKAAAFYTLWSPNGWRTSDGLKVGDPIARVTELYGALPAVACGTYSAYVLRRKQIDTIVYAVEDRVWGLGLSRAGARPCP